MSVFKLTNDLVFPDPSYAEDDGLLAIGGDLSAERLLLAYSNGIFPWYSQDSPIIWWSPDPRLVLFPEKFRVSKSLKQKIKQGVFRVEFDKNFRDVIHHCAIITRKEQDRTWITEDLEKAFINLHELGYAHSVEAYLDNALAGGLYGMSLGKAFFGESMFHLETDASKVALYYLVEKLKRYDFHFIDAQVKSSHLISLGAEEISRKEYLRLLTISLRHETKHGKWS